MQWAMNQGSKTFNYKQVSRDLGILDTPSRQVVLAIIYELVENGQLIEVRTGKFKTKHKNIFVEGKAQFTQRGAAYIITDDTEEDIFIPASRTGQALNGDTVKVSLSKNLKKGQPSGQILEVLKRAKSKHVGRIDINKKFAFLVTDEQKMHVDIFIPHNKLNGATNGQKVIAKITSWPTGASSPFGEIIEVLGEPGDPNVEASSILASYGFPTSFPSHVEEWAEKIPLAIDDAEKKKRKDFTKITTFTIDPVDAKDFDDALSFKKLPNGNVEVGVHIADVSHYVQPGSPIDKEAAERATSIYLVDQVIPMLPEALSNVVCSLRPQEEKLCFAVIFEVSESGKVVNYSIEKTIIFSDRRFTYEEVQEILEGKDGDYSEELRTLNGFAKSMREKRMSSGAIAFDKEEVKFQLNAEKQPIGVYFKTQKDAHKLIEEFMLLANRTVAAQFGKKHSNQDVLRSFVFRIHDQPDPGKLIDLSQFVRNFGYSLGSTDRTSVAASINKLLKAVKGKGEERVIEQMAIRSMAKAVYSTKNIGHYGLSFPYYTHFTSPIRRYPDLQVHRLIEFYLAGGKSVDIDFLEDQCKHDSEMERKAAEAERASTKYFQVLFMQDKVGMEFDGMVSGISEWGIYIEIEENKCEGMIRLRDLNDDSYYFDESAYKIVGHNHGKEINLGDRIRIKIIKADLENRRLDFKVVNFL